MNYYHTNEEIDEIGEGLIRKYDYNAFIRGESTNIEGFITEHLNYKIVYDRIADSDAGRMAFLSDGKTPLWVWRNGKRTQVIPPPNTIIIDEFLLQENAKPRKRFVLAHEAGHIIMDLLCNVSVTAAFNNEFDSEQNYSIQDLACMFNINENKATSMGVALLMPRTSVINRAKQLITTKRIPLYGNSVLCDKDRIVISKLAEHFQVSYKSMFYRLRDLKMFEPRDIDEYLAQNLGKLGGERRIVPSYELTVDEFDIWKKKLEDEALDYWHTDHRQTRNNVSIENLLETDLVVCESVEDEMIRKHDEEQRRSARLKEANELLESLTKTQRRRYIKAVAYKKTNRVIAAEEGCSHQMVSKSVSQAEARIQEAKDKRRSNA